MLKHKFSNCQKIIMQKFNEINRFQDSNEIHCSCYYEYINFPDLYKAIKNSNYSEHYYDKP